MTFTHLKEKTLHFLLLSRPSLKRMTRIVWISAAVLFCSFVFYITSVIWNPFNLFGPMPSLSDIENPKQDMSSEVISADGVSLGRFFKHNRSMVTYDELSPMLVRTLVISEDHRFYQHAGLDFPAFVRVIAGIAVADPRGGGSTLTQQTAKNLFATRGPELMGKIGAISSVLDLLISKTKEWIIAVRLEQNFTKDEILTLYLNTVAFNYNSYGIKIAAQTYFSKTPAALSQQECATLVGMLQNPIIFNPITHPDRALRKRNEVLDKLYAHNVITSRQILNSLKATPVQLNVSVESHNRGLAPYFRTTLQKELQQWAAARNINLSESGLRIYTTIDSRLQLLAEQAVRNKMSAVQKVFDADWGARNPWVDDDGNELRDFVDRKMRQSDEYRQLVAEYGKNSDSITLKLNERKRTSVFSWNGKKEEIINLKEYIQHQSRFLHCGLMSMDPMTGEVKAWVGGIDHTFFQYDHVKQGSRQAGSTFKAFVYGLAMENGFSPCQEFVDMSPEIHINGKIYQPKNANGTFGDGKAYTLRRALAKSLNSVTMQLMTRLTPQNVADFAHRLGITTRLDPVYSLGLGTSDVRLYDMVAAYSSFVNGGIHTEPYYLVRIEDQYGNIIESFSPTQKQVLEPETAYKIVYLLRGGVEEEGGSSHALSDAVTRDNEVGGKTGTTDNGSDGWYMGITPNLVTGVWVGGDERSIHFPNWGESSGGRTALPIWDSYMKGVYSHPHIGYQKGRFKQPPGMESRLVCDDSDNNQDHFQ
jgi:penicillin-binding protein 1A